MFTRRATRRALCFCAAAAWMLSAGAHTAWSWAWPADGAVLRGFSVSSDPYAAGQHRGIDVALGSSGSVRAPASGEVSFAGPVPTHGLTVTIVTRDGYRASLTHLGTLRVRKGASVREGDPIADAGPTGEPEHATPYVHLGIRVGDAETYVDPLELLPSRSAPNPPPASAAPPATTPPPEAEHLHRSRLSLPPRPTPPRRPLLHRLLLPRRSRPRPHRLRRPRASPPSLRAALSRLRRRLRRAGRRPRRRKGSGRLRLGLASSLRRR